MFLRRDALSLGTELPQSPDDLGSRLSRLNDGVDETALGGDVGIRELVAILGDQLSAQLFGALAGSLDLLGHRVDCAFQHPMRLDLEGSAPGAHLPGGTGRHWHPPAP